MPALERRRALHDGDHDGRTPLHIAAAAGHLMVVQFLIDQPDVDV
jgi:ankyrin repeat protein